MHNPRHTLIINGYGRWLRHPRTLREARYATDVPDDVELTAHQAEQLRARRTPRNIPDAWDDKPLSIIR
jgi:hypothetical protein